MQDTGPSSLLRCWWRFESCRM